jgi:hypothetical protein
MSQYHESAIRVPEGLSIPRWSGMDCRAGPSSAGLRRHGRNLAILLAMTISEQMSLADVKNRLSR